MPKLPDTSAIRSVPQSSRPIVGYDGGAVGRAIANAGKQLAVSAERQLDKKSRFEYERAKSHLLIKSIEAENELEADNEFGTWEKRYGERMQKARQEAGALLSDPDYMELFDIESDEMITRGTAGVLGRVRTKEKDFGKATLRDQLTRNGEFIKSTKNPAARMGLIESAHGLIQSAYDRGYIGADEAVAERQNWTHQLARDWVSSQDPAELEQLLTHNTLKPTPELGKLYRVESGGDPGAKNPKSSATGLAQFVKGTAKQYGLTDPTDGAASDKAAAQLWEDNRVGLGQKIGREPRNGEIYLAHQQGLGGAAALLGNPDMRAVDALVQAGVDPEQAAKAVKDNGGGAGMLAKDFAAKWIDKYENAKPVEEVKLFQKTGTPLDFLPYEEKVALIAKLPQMKKAQRDAQELQVMDVVMPLMAETNGDWTQIPQPVQARAKELGLWAKITEYKGASDGDYLVDLNNLPPDKLAEVDFNSTDIKLKLSREDREKYAVKAADIRNKPDAANFLRTRDQMITSAFDGKKIDLKSDKGKQLRANMEMLLDAEMEQTKRETGKYPDRNRIQEMISAQFMARLVDKTSFRWSDSGKKPFEYSMSDISEENRQQIIDALRADDLPITEGNILSLYVRGLARGE
jgi:hypothetical protein